MGLLRSMWFVGTAGRSTFRRMLDFLGIMLSNVLDFIFSCVSTRVRSWVFDCLCVHGSVDVTCVSESAFRL